MSVVSLGVPETSPSVARHVIASAISSASRSPLAASSVAATPATCGVAIDVPDSVAYDESELESVVDGPRCVRGEGGMHA